MQAKLSKTNYILYRECPKNAWIKIHKPGIYFASPLTEFEKSIIETGNEVDLLARELFPTAEFQKKFETENYLAITDIFKEEDGGITVYEVKATSEIDATTHYHDLAFQVVVLEMCGHKVKSANLIHLNNEYVRSGEIELTKLFKVEEVSAKISEIKDTVKEEMQKALAYLNQESEPAGPCSCIYKGRSRHCTTFNYSNPHVPEYSVHDLSRIGVSKRKLTELIDGNKFTIEELPEHFDFTDVQKNQIWAYLNNETIVSREHIAEELETLKFPLHFLDYETFPAALPRFNGFSPYMQIPFQYSLHILASPEAEPEHYDFLYTESSDPSREFAESLQNHLKPEGSVIVWHKSFECSRNRELAKRLPEFKNFFANLETRIYDLEDIFKKQYHVHKDYKGSSSIKKVLPVLAPTLSYKELAVREGASAADVWDKLAKGAIKGEEWEKGVKDLREYCKLDTYAMYVIWKELYKIVN